MLDPAILGRAGSGGEAVGRSAAHAGIERDQPAAARLGEIRLGHGDGGRADVKHTQPGPSNAGQVICAAGISITRSIRPPGS